VSNAPGASAPDPFDQLANKARSISTPPKTRNTVRVGCSLPHGLSIMLYKPGKTIDGETINLPASDPVVLNGANKSSLIGGVGFTDVDEEFWTAWEKQSVDYRPLKLGLIWAEGSRERALSRADEMKTVRTGFEGINPDKPGKGVKRYDPKDMDVTA
jgi:hypothetical protein